MKEQICMMMVVMMTTAALTNCSGGARETTAAPTMAETAAETTQTPAAGEKTEARSLTGETTIVQAGEPTEILVATAVNLRDVYEDKLIPAFQEQHPGVVVKDTYDSSGKLRVQIKEGLRADVFMSVATEQMIALDEEDMIESDTITNLLEGKIVLIVPVGSNAGSEKLEDIEKAESITLGDPASVPAGQYTQEALTSLGIWDKTQGKVNFGTNMTEMPNQMAASNADAGIVYTTDTAGMTDQVQVVTETSEGSLGGRIIYPAAVVKNTVHTEEVENSVGLLRMDETMKVFEEYGFTKGK